MATERDLAAASASGLARASGSWTSGSENRSHTSASRSMVLDRKYSLRLTLASMLAAIAWLALAPAIGWTLTPIAKMFTGIVLLAWIAALWMLFLARVGRDPAEIKLWHRAHRWAAATICLPLMLHTQTIGYGTTASMMMMFFATMLIGAVNRETLTVRSRSFWSAWMIVKVGLATSLLALIGLHVYISLRYH